MNIEFKDQGSDMPTIVDALRRDDNPRIIETLTLTGVSRLRIERSSDSTYLIDADGRRFYMFHPERNKPELIMSKSYSGARHAAYSGSPPDDNPSKIALCSADNPKTIVLRRLTAHSYDLDIGRERFTFRSARETGPPVDLLDSPPGQT